MTHSTKNNLTAGSAHSKKAKYIAVGLILSGIAAILLAFNARPDLYNPLFYTSNRSDWLNGLCVAFILLEVVLAYMLKRTQGGMYWWFWLQLTATQPDERQKIVRQRVFERAYGYALICAFLAVSFMLHVTNYANEEAVGSIIHATAWAVAIFLVSLPSVLAAWQKDS